MEHNKLCSLHGGTKGKFPCCLCSTIQTNLDSPNKLSMSKMMDGNKIKGMLNDDPGHLKSIGYYPCQTNVFYRLQHCDTRGLNQSLPPDILHAVLLGNVTRLINGFAHLKKLTVIHILFFLIPIRMNSKEIYCQLEGHCQNRVIFISLEHIFPVDICLIPKTQKTSPVVRKVCMN